jgi:DNA-directed RNA polymerase subunit M/transcription elongation factor TFIIS
MPEIMYLRENHEKMSYIYLCCVCDHTWNHSMS